MSSNPVTNAQAADPFEPPRRGLLNRFLPRGLFPRSLLIVAVPILLLQIALAFVFMERHRDVTTQRLTNAAAADAAALILLAESARQENFLPQTAEKLSLTLSESQTLPEARAFRPALLYSSLSNALETRLETRGFRLALAGDGKRVQIFIRLKEGARSFPAPVMVLETSLSRVYATNSHIFIVWMAGISMLLLLIAFLFLRGQIRPIQRLAQAAHQLGRGLEIEGFKPTGATEIREAGNAFLQMQQRLRRYITQRTQMLNGVSHDLRTPLTRISLQLALLPENEQTKAMKRDMDEMKSMLEDYLSFARGQQYEPVMELNLNQLVQEAAGQPASEINIDIPANIVLYGRHGALRRCLANLIGNARVYGETIQVSGASDGRYVGIDIDDDGPGIPEASHEDVFRPFFRLDKARNQDEGKSGTGLGLAIARDAARAHGGDIYLMKSPLGGLRARLVLPA